MARQKRNRGELELAARYFENAAQKIREAIKTMENAELSEVLIHGDVIFNRFLPAIWDWSCRLPFEAQMQAADYTNERPTHAAIVKSRAKADSESLKKRKPKP